MARKGAVLSPAEMLRNRVNASLKQDVVQMASDEKFVMHKVSTESLVLDRLTGGGWTRGRHHELYGDEGVGKSHTLYVALVAAQQRGEVAAIVDGEHVFDEARFKHLGGNVDELLIWHPTSAEEVIKVLMLFADNSEDNPSADVVGIDSVASMVPLEELAKDPTEGDDRIGSLARTMSKLLRRVTTVNDNTVFIWTNQVRDKIGSYVPGVTTPGGRALRFYASTRIQMNRQANETSERQIVKKGKFENSKVKTGHWINVRSEKEKTAAPHRTGLILFDAERGGFDTEQEMVDLGMEDGLVDHSGQSYEYDGLSARGLSGFKKKLAEDEERWQELYSLISDNTRTLVEDE